MQVIRRVHEAASVIGQSTETETSSVGFNTGTQTHALQEYQRQIVHQTYVRGQDTDTQLEGETERETERDKE